jgi:hypothetical protein
VPLRSLPFQATTIRRPQKVFKQRKPVAHGASGLRSVPRVSSLQLRVASRDLRVRSAPATMKSLNGASFALIEATVVLATLLRGFRFRPVPGHKSRPVARGSGRRAECRSLSRAVKQGGGVGCGQRQLGVMSAGLSVSAPSPVCPQLRTYYGSAANRRSGPQPEVMGGAAHYGVQCNGLMPMKLARCASIRANGRPEHNPVPRTTSSSLASCFEHCRFKRLTRARAGPGYKLERRVVSLAHVEGSRQEHLALSTRHLGATGKHERMTKHD